MLAGLVRSRRMPIAICVFENLKSFEDICRETAATGSGSNAAATEGTLRWCCRPLDWEIVTRNAP
jgi:hypothetical protein